MLFSHKPPLILSTVVATADADAAAAAAVAVAGDIILEVNGHRIRSPETAASLLDGRRPGGTLTLAMIPVDGHRHAQFEGLQRAGAPGSRIRKARDLFAKVNVVMTCFIDRSFNGRGRC